MLAFVLCAILSVSSAQLNPFDAQVNHTVSTLMGELKIQLNEMIQSIDAEPLHQSDGQLVKREASDLYAMRNNLLLRFQPVAKNVIYQQVAESKNSNKSTDENVHELKSTLEDKWMQTIGEFQKSSGTKHKRSTTEAVKAAEVAVEEFASQRQFPGVFQSTGINLTPEMIQTTTKLINYIKEIKSRMQTLLLEKVKLQEELDAYVANYPKEELEHLELDENYIILNTQMSSILDSLLVVIKQLPTLERRLKTQLTQFSNHQLPTQSEFNLADFELLLEQSKEILKEEEMTALKDNAMELALRQEREAQAIRAYRAALFRKRALWAATAVFSLATIYLVFAQLFSMQSTHEIHVTEISD